MFTHDYSVAKAVARRIADLVTKTPRVVLGLPTGRTPIGLYRELVSLHHHGVDFSQVTTFNLDEFLGIPANHPGSYRSFMEEHLFSHVNIKPENRHFLNGTTRDPEAECLRYEREIADAGGIDLQVLGIGTNGHIGFNEPAPTLVATGASCRAETGNAPQQCVALWRRSDERSARSAIGRHGDDSALARDRAAGDRPVEGAVHRTGGQRSVDAGTARVIPSAARRCGHHAGRAGG